MTYDVVLIEHAVGDGLSVEETTEMLRSFDKGAELLPLEIDSCLGDSSAMGFITTKADEVLRTKVTITDFEEYVGAILSDMSLEHEDHVYRYENLVIWIARFAPDADTDHTKVTIPLNADTSLVAERGSDHNYKEICVYVQKGGNVCWQDLAVIREAYDYNEALDVIPIQKIYEVMVYGDSSKEDYTNKFTICEHVEEEHSDE